MNHPWWMEYLPFIVLGVAHIIIGALVVGIVVNTKEGEKDVEKKCCDKSGGFLAGLLVGWWLF